MKLQGCSSYLNRYLLVLLVIAMSTLPSETSMAPTSAMTDRASLLSFKSSISDPSDALASWVGNSTLQCQWRGVKCALREHSQRVIYLSLPFLNLTGVIPPHIANLTFLTILDLGINSFHGSIPHEIGRLSRLRRLTLRYNDLGGEIPNSLTRCSQLESIHLVRNELRGGIPADIGLLTKLRVLTASKNHLTGPIPPSIGNLSSLRTLYLLDNNLEGSLPPSLGKLFSLLGLSLGNNRLSGEIPSSIYNLSSIQALALRGNLLVGEVPADIFNTLPNLVMLLLSGNRLKGKILTSMSNASNLGDIEINDNYFTGTFPSNLGNLQNLYWIEFSDNQLEAKRPADWDFLASLANCSLLQVLGFESNNLRGNLPTSIANLPSNLKVLGLGGNQISGTIPDGIGNLVNLTSLSLNDNLLTGSIPDTIGRLHQLGSFSLSGNRLSGPIPNSISNLTLLSRLYLGGNELNGSIPRGLGNCQSLQELDLSRNKLTGVVPAEVLSIPSLGVRLDLSYNSLTGSLPSEIGRMSNLNVLNISNNKFSGAIPSSLGRCLSLEYLSMQDNLFNGTIPQSLESLKGLRELDLSSNRLSGKVPDYLEKLGVLMHLNLSFNNLEGSVPNQGIFRNSTVVSVVGNKNLCGGPAEYQLPACYTTYPERRNKSIVLKVVLPVVAAAFLLALLVIYVTRRSIKNLRKKSSFTAINEQFMKVSYAELLKATDGFSRSNLIGAGSVGSVYKGTMALDGSTVAVKVLNLQVRGASESFMAECEVLRNIRHRNLVRILTACSSVDFKGNDFKALVLELMTNGSLENWLHPEAFEQDGKTNLSFIQRLNIAIDVASALEYLHHHGQTPIVHCDLKPSNVLLDVDMCAHVGDFGLARFLPEGALEPDEQKTRSAGVNGTIGYIAPEYGMGGEASTHGDVYSYGILLLELFTGRRPTDEILKDGLDLHKYVEMAFPNQLMDIVDPRLHLLVDEQEPQTNDQNRNNARMEEVKCLETVIRIALSCLKQDPNNRMAMENVKSKLHAARKLLDSS